ncbi:MAG TPA: hypothetical protein EYP56_17190 [Planctomycetaceae bacterium]|nr:hypothetical protein [Planctomycetaceae bacterium]HIQ23231.1 hypothetical protein [Planctomycetota bacterium]
MTTLLSSGALVASDAPAECRGKKRRVPLVRGAFIYPPSEQLRKAGYFSWPGSSFDAEGHQRTYTDQIAQIARDLQVHIQMDQKPLDGDESVARFIAEVKHSEPDGLLLVPFKKGHWPKVVRIIEETGIPSVVLATLGVLLVGHINQLHRRTGVYLISAMDDLKSVREGMAMIRAARRMKDSLLVRLAGDERREARVPHLGTTVRSVPLQQFYQVYEETPVDEAVKELAASYHKGAKEIVEPSAKDIVDAARACFALKRVVEAEGGDAVMMDCLPGLRKPRKHVPPCMGFMTLRDEGIPAGCQADLNATLSLMLVQELVGLPGFQQNAAMNTTENHYFGAHCTAPSKMLGPKGRAEPYILRTHAEAGWGCVPQILFKPGQEVTMALYQSGEQPRMLIYSGKIVRCYPKAPGGCRTNIEMTINEVDDVCKVQGMHQAIFYGNHARQLHRFCRLYGIEAVS